MKHFALIVAAGKSERMNSPLPKPYLKINGLTVLENALKVFLNAESIEKIVVVVSENDQHFQTLSISHHPKIIRATGGATRLLSSLAGLKALASFANSGDWIWEHDAARPCFTQKDFDAALALLSQNKIKDGLVLAYPAIDTLKQIDSGAPDTIHHTLDRSSIWQAATPQIFPYETFTKALTEAQSRTQITTDSASALEATGAKLQILKCDRSNIKITEASDLVLANFYLHDEKKTMRIGHGLDVHAFKVGRDLILGGVTIPHHQGLEGHSDADVVIHALCDAMLGALALGDIGTHFSDQDPTYKNADSRLFLKKINQLIRAKGYHVHNADITIAAQAPKLAPHILKMRSNLAEDLEIALDNLSIKATTTERLGFIGREEGISVDAVVLLNKN